MAEYIVYILMGYNCSGPPSEVSCSALSGNCRDTHTQQETGITRQTLMGSPLDLWDVGGNWSTMRNPLSR